MQRAIDSSARAAAKRRSGSLSTMLLPDLQQLAGSLGISPGKLKKSDLVAAIESVQSGGNGASSNAGSTARRAVAPHPPRRRIGRLEPHRHGPVQPALIADLGPADNSAPSASGRRPRSPGRWSGRERRASRAQSEPPRPRGRPSATGRTATASRTGRRQPEPNATRAATPQLCRKR